MKVLWYSNAPWTGTGYGQQTDIFTRRLLADGHDVAVHANFGLHGAKLDWHGMPVYPQGFDTWSNDIAGLHAQHHFRGQRGVIITLCDVWVLKGPAWEENEVISWTPVDHQPAPPKVIDYFKHSKATPVAMSLWGQERLAAAGLEDVWYAPHGIETNIYKPTPEIGGTSVRELFGLPEDAFVFGMNAANKGNHKIRKSFPEVFTAFAMFHRQHPDSLLHLHTEKFGQTMGVDLKRLAVSCGVPETAISFTDQYAYRLGLSPEALAGMYTAWDCLLAPSMGEGFGIPVIEAQACGTPVIVSDFSAQPELVGSGWTVGGVRDWDEGQAAWLHLPDVIEIAAAMQDAYEGGGDAVKAREFALGYDADVVHEKYWRPIMNKIEARWQLPEVPDVQPIFGGGR